MISKPRLFLIFISPILFTVLIVLVSLRALKSLSDEPSVPYGANITMFADAQPDGGKLFLQHCASCHGVNGDGNGTAGLNLKARYFGYDKYKFVSAYHPDGKASGPTDADLHQRLEHGIPGSPMPAFPSLTEAERNAVIAHVRRLETQGIYHAARERARKDVDNDPEAFEDEKYLAHVRKMMPFFTVGKTLEVKADFTPSPERLANGKKLFQANCVQCHGHEGKGDGANIRDPKFLNEDGSVPQPRNLTTGLFKGGDSHKDIYTRLVIGIPGTAMYNFLRPEGQLSLPEHEIADIVLFVKSLSEGK